MTFAEAHPPLFARNNLLTASQAGDLAVESVQVQLATSHTRHLLIDSQQPLQAFQGGQKEPGILAHSLMSRLSWRVMLRRRMDTAMRCMPH